MKQAPKKKTCPKCGRRTLETTATTGPAGSVFVRKACKCGYCNLRRFDKEA